MLGLLLAGALILAPGPAAACACCGLDGWWSAKERGIDGDAAKLLAGISLLDGKFDDSPGTDHDYPISRISRAPRSFSFATPAGRFEFRFGETFTQRASDITFITQPKYALDNVADIYHEIILRGTLRVPRGTANLPAGTPLPATMILQGSGGACVEAGLFRRWLLRIEGSALKASGRAEGRQP